MKDRIVKGLLIPGLFICSIHLNLQAAPEKEYVDYWGADRQMLVDLVDNKQELPALAKKMAARNPKTGKEALYKMDVLLRAGMDREAVSAVKALKRYSTNFQSSYVQNICTSWCNPYENWRTERAVLEDFSYGIEDPWWVYDLLDPLVKSGWSVDDIDAWLAERSTSINSNWVDLRLRFAYQQGTQGRVIESFSETFKKNPNEIESLISFLDRVQNLRSYGSRSDEQPLPTDFLWVAELVNPESLIDNERIGQKLIYLNEYQAAEIFYRRTLERSLTDKEIESLQKDRNGSPEQTQLNFRSQALSHLAQCLSHLQRDDEAQKLYREQNAITKELQESGYWSGRQSYDTSDTNTAKTSPPDEALLAEEEKSSGDPKYWKRRAGYHISRDEYKEAEDACKKGLALAIPAPLDESKGDWQSDTRASLIHSYYFLFRKQQIKQGAFEVLRNEVSYAPTSKSAMQAMSDLIGYEEEELRSDDQALWTWLSHRPAWKWEEERLLTAMLDNTGFDERNLFFTRASELANNGNRAGVLGKILNKYAYFDRAIPYLESALEKTSDEYGKSEVAKVLFDVYKEKKRWRDAEKMIQHCRRNATIDSYAKMHTDLAIMAAESGAKTDALRLWKISANMKPAETSDLYTLAKLGLKEDLVIFYKDFQKKLPTSNIPKRALRVLGAG